jgi:hypothetical protein
VLPDPAESSNGGRDRSSGADLDPSHVSSFLQRCRHILALVCCYSRSKPSGMKKVVHSVKENVFVGINDGGQHDSCHWVLDIGASNHMSG